MHIILVEPEIPQNTGNIVRTCALTGSNLHLVKPLGFSITDRHLKRAGLDYWDEVRVQVWENFAAVENYLAGKTFYLATTKAYRSYVECLYEQEDVLVFGKETEGLPKQILNRYRENQVRIPMMDCGRSLNLSNSVAIMLYEALRQQNFAGLR